MRNQKNCWADTFIEFNNLGKLLRFQIEFLGKDTDIYKKVKQNDYSFGFGLTSDGMPTLFVCENNAAKLKYLKDKAKIGFNAPILTKAEYFTLMKAWWYAYAEMTNNGESRISFSFSAFIANLHAKADDWHINADSAEMVMGAFGYNAKEGRRFTNGEEFEWMSYKYGSRSSDIALDFTTFLYLSWIPEKLPYQRFYLWKSTF